MVGYVLVGKKKQVMYEYLYIECCSVVLWSDRFYGGGVANERIIIMAIGLTAHLQ